PPRRAGGRGGGSAGGSRCRHPLSPPRPAGRLRPGGAANPFVPPLRPHRGRGGGQTPGVAGMSERFAGQVVFITGAASGIGAAAARRFASEGARLALCDLNGERLEAVAGELGIPREQVLMRALDIADSEALCRYVDDTTSHFGALDILVNNAGIGCFGHVDEITPEAWRKTFAVDLDAVFFASRTALPHLRKTRGNIVNTASISGLLGDPGLVAYNVAKAGVVNLTRNMALDHAHEGIRVNCIRPGAVATPLP